MTEHVWNMLVLAAAGVLVFNVLLALVLAVVYEYQRDRESS